MQKQQQPPAPVSPAQVWKNATLDTQNTIRQKNLQIKRLNSLEIQTALFSRMCLHPRMIRRPAPCKMKTISKSSKLEIMGVSRTRITFTILTLILAAITWALEWAEREHDQQLVYSVEWPSFSIAPCVMASLLLEVAQLLRDRLFSRRNLILK